jgi:parallel beta-helix repeat protein
MVARHAGETKIKENKSMTPKTQNQATAKKTFANLSGRLASLFALLACSLFLVTTMSAKTITVTGTGDTIAVDGLVTLREAIMAANTNLPAGDAPAGNSGLDTIVFNISGTGVRTIHLNGALPTIFEPLVIDGYTQRPCASNPAPCSKVSVYVNGSDAVLLIEIDGSNAGAASGLKIAAPNCKIRGLVINRFQSSLIEIAGPAGGSATIEGNFLGTNAEGTAGFNSGSHGIYISASSFNVIGGDGPDKRNVISGNSNCNVCTGGVGIFIVDTNGPANFNRIQGNSIGTDAGTTTALGNGIGIVLAGDGNLVGGKDDFTSNNISGNHDFGIIVEDSDSNFIQGNKLGLGATGSANVGNAAGGILVRFGSKGTTIGGTDFDERNYIEANGGPGIYLRNGPSGTIIQNNISNNNKGDGIWIEDSAGNEIGGTAANEGNVIAFNDGCGVKVTGAAAVGNRLHGNVINGNGQLGIDLGGDGVTPNDNVSFDPDTGPNLLQNYPLITSATSLGNITAIKGSLKSKSQEIYVVEFFSSVDKDASGYGEGQTPIGSIQVVTDLLGGASFSTAFPVDTVGKQITATATEAGTHNTSEFSQAVLSVGPIDMTIGNVIVTEGNSGQQQMIFTVSLFKTAFQDVTVNYATADGTATAPSDYATTSGVLTIPAGSSEGKIAVAINNDVMFEPDETLTLKLSNPQGATFVIQSQGTGTIKNNDPQPTITVSDIEAGEGNSGTTPFSFAMSLSNPSYQPITVEYATADGTATAGSDYQAAKATFTFQPGQPFQNVPLIVNVNGDTAIEPRETFFLNLSNPVNATIAKAQGVAAISNDDLTSISIDDISKAEGNNGATNFSFNVTLAQSSDVPVTVDYLTVDGTAQGGSDFLTATGTLTFGPNETSKSVTVNVMGDSDVEPDETFLVKLLNLTGPVSFVKAEGTGTIINDDAAAGPSIQFSQATYGVAEQLGAITVTVTRSGDVSGGASVDYATADDSAAQKSDFEYAAGTLSFSPGEVSKTFIVLLNQDSYSEGPESFKLVLSNPAGAALGPQAVSQVSITDDLPETVSNPIDDAQTFVYMHYHDFLSREPDPAGLAFWTNEITSCGNDAQCVDHKRINVSAAFFLSIEFQETGYLRYLMQKESFGSTPKYAEFMRDVQEVSRGVVVKAPGWEQKLKDNQLKFAENWTNRPDFKALYDGLSNDAYVTALYKNAGIPVPQAEKDQLVAALNAASMNRATVLLDVAADATFRQQEQNAAFVMMEYFGYLRRDPNAAPDSDLSGYNFWLNKLNQFGGNYIDAEMIKAFITSFEYRQRFAQ